VRPVAGRDYPGSYAELLSWFDRDWKCLNYLDWLRWPSGFVCPHCAAVVGWRMRDYRWHCGGCGRKVSATAGTIFHRTRTPLTVWFSAAWMLTSGKGGVSASALQRQLELGSYQTAWAMAHRYRSVMVRPGRERLNGQVEVDETYIGGTEPGVPGRGALSKVLTAIAVEVMPPRGFGRARIAVIDNAKTATLRGFLTGAVEPGATVITDGLPAYRGATRNLFEHEPRPVWRSGQTAADLLPAVHRVASLTKRWLLGTLQGSVSREHLPAYLDEFVFRFNRRNSTRRGLLFYRLLSLAVGGDPITYRELRKAGHWRPAPAPPTGSRPLPPSLERGPAGLPWRDDQEQAPTAR
jgi:transposase-like protein